MRTPFHSPGPPWSRRRWLQASSAATTLAGLGCASALAQLRVEITGVGATQIPVALAPFRDEAATGVALSAVIRANLERSGAFRVIAVPPGLDERSVPDLPAFRGQGADALVAGSATRLADGSVDVRVRLWDAVRGAELAGQSSVVLPADLRLAAHRLSDLIHEKLTGQRGVFATRIAYVLRTGRRFTLHVTDPDGEGGQVALASPEPLISPAWSPDGRRLAYTGYQSGYADVYEIDLGSGSRRRIMKYPGTNSGAAYSPDGGRFAVTLSKDGNPELYVTDSGGGSPRRLTMTSGVESSPTWSPDGREIIYSSDSGGSPMLYRISSSGGSPSQIRTGHSYNTEPNWSPDGRKVAFNVRGGGSFNVAVIEFPSGQVRLLGEGQSPAWGPDSRHVVYGQGGSLVVLDIVTLQRITIASNLGRISEPSWSR